MNESLVTPGGGATTSASLTSVGMALLVHQTSPPRRRTAWLPPPTHSTRRARAWFYRERCSGGEAEWWRRRRGLPAISFIYEFTFPGQPIIYLSHSNLVPAGSTVLTRSRSTSSVWGSDAIHNRFASAYRPDPSVSTWYAMDVEFKFDGDPGTEPALVVKQARPYPGRGQ